MEFVTKYGNDVNHLTGIANASLCNLECQGNMNCFEWTYHDGACFLKNEKTFLIKTDGLVTGVKDCSGEGKVY